MAAAGIVFLLNGSYLVRQGVGFVADRLRARSNAVAARRWPEYAEFLAETDVIRAFGHEHLGLNPTSNYTKFIKTQKDHVAYVVSASRPLAFVRKTWRYPLVGTAPYRGFYTHRAAVREAGRLESEGWETIVRKVSAFSSLGYATDPLYSYMSTYDPERIASLLIHEMTHATIWVPGDAALNEAIATYVGDLGALAYLEHRYGLASEIAAEASRRHEERARFKRFIRTLASRLDLVYVQDAPDTWKRAQRDAIIDEERLLFAQGHLGPPGSDPYSWVLDHPLTNAYLDLHLTYNEDIGLVSSFHRVFADDLGDLVAALKELHAMGDLRASLESLVASG